MIRGREERQRVAKAKPARSWKFHKYMKRTFDAAGSTNVARFYIEVRTPTYGIDIHGNKETKP